MSIIFLNVEEVLRLHFKIIEDFGGSHGVRDERRLQSVIRAPKQETFGQEQYATLYEKAAVYLRNIVGDHPFVDGNKRTAVTICAIFLARNGVKLTPAPKDLEDFVVKAVTDHLSVAEIAEWLEEYSS